MLDSQKFVISHPSFLGASCQITATASAVASLFDSERGNIFTQTERAWTVDLSTLILLLLPRPIWSGVSCSIYYFVATSPLHLDRRALPLTVSFSDCGSPQAFREKLDQKLASLAVFPRYLSIFMLSISLSNISFRPISAFQPSASALSVARFIFTLGL